MKVADVENQLPQKQFPLENESLAEEKRRLAKEAFRRRMLLIAAILFGACLLFGFIIVIVNLGVPSGGKDAEHDTASRLVSLVSSGPPKSPGQSPVQMDSGDQSLQPLNNDNASGSVSSKELYECRRRWFTGNKNSPRDNSFVCVCDSQHCDRPEPWTAEELTPAGEAIVFYMTDKAEHRLKKGHTRFTITTATGSENNVNKAKRDTEKQGEEGKKVEEEKKEDTKEEKKEETKEEKKEKEKDATGEYLLHLNFSNTYQKVFGYGGAFTDAAGINLRTLSEKTQAQLLQTYFSQDNGIGYSIGRVPIASTDISTHEYSYLDTVDDFDLKSFALAPEDFKYKIPYVLAAMKLSEGNLKLFASPWSAPGWMKTNGRMKDGAEMKGEFLGQYYVTYANYLERFFTAYAKKGIHFWGMTIQNEPRKGQWLWQTMQLKPDMQRDFAYALLSPTFKKHEATRDIKIMVFDDNRGEAFEAARDHFYNDPEKAQAIDGIATHWYDHGDFNNLTAVHNFRPDKFILASEACNGDNWWEHIPLPGDWHRGRLYGFDIINNMRNWVIGWTDWNLCLDMQGGPNWANNFVDAPILVNATADEFYKQPMFYFLAHFSKFVPRGSVRVDSQLVEGPKGEDIKKQQQLEHVAFETPSGERVLVLINQDPEKAMEVRFRDVESGEGKKSEALLRLPADSIVTALWRRW